MRNVAAAFGPARSSFHRCRAFSEKQSAEVRRTLPSPAGSSAIEEGVSPDRPLYDRGTTEGKVRCSEIQIAHVDTVEVLHPCSCCLPCQSRQNFRVLLPSEATTVSWCSRDSDSNRVPVL